VAEIILIDNDKTKTSDLSFLKSILNSALHNLSVNPSWNMGVKIAKNELICFCNDDIQRFEQRSLYVNWLRILK
jgi:hypothetical protein